MSRDARGLLQEDWSEIRMVDASVRDVWFRHARPEYFCPDCGRVHFSWSGIGQRHDPRKQAARLATPAEGSGE